MAMHRDELVKFLKKAMKSLPKKKKSAKKPTNSTKTPKEIAIICERKEERIERQFSLWRTELEPRTKCKDFMFLPNGIKNDLPKNDQFNAVMRGSDEKLKLLRFHSIDNRKINPSFRLSMKNFRYLQECVKCSEKNSLYIADCSFEDGKVLCFAICPVEIFIEVAKRSIDLDNTNEAATIMVKWEHFYKGEVLIHPRNLVTLLSPEEKITVTKTPPKKITNPAENESVFRSILMEICKKIELSENGGVINLSSLEIKLIKEKMNLQDG